MWYVSDIMICHTLLQIDNSNKNSVSKIVWDNEPSNTSSNTNEGDNLFNYFQVSVEYSLTYATLALSKVLKK